MLRTIFSFCALTKRAFADFLPFKSQKTAFFSLPYRILIRRFVYLVCGASIFCAPTSSYAFRTPFGDEVFQTVERGVAWIKVQIQNGQYNNWSTGLGGVVLLERKLTSDWDSPRRGYENASPEDQELLEQMVAYCISQDASLRDQGGAYSYGTGNFLLFLSLFRQTGGPNNVGAAVTVDQAIINGVNRLQDRQGHSPNSCNSGPWSYNNPASDGDLSTTQFALAGLSAAQGIYPAAANTLLEAEEFLDNSRNNDHGMNFWVLEI